MKGDILEVSEVSSCMYNTQGLPLNRIYGGGGTNYDICRGFQCIPIVDFAVICETNYSPEKCLSTFVFSTLFSIEA